MVHRKTCLGALDLGSDFITFLQGEITPQGFNLVGHARIPSAGIHKGKIKDPQALTKTLGTFLDSLSKKFSPLPEMLCVSQSGSHLRSMQYETSLSLKGFQHVIDEQDIKKVNQLALQKELPSEDVFLHHFQQSYAVDNVAVDHPLGLSGRQLSVSYNTIFGKTQPIKNQLYSVNQFGFRVKNLVFSGIASALATTSSIERENGICVIDIGGQITEFVVYKRQIPVLMGVLPVGGRNFTYDLCSGLRIHMEDADRLKCEYGIPLNEENGEIWAVGNHEIGDKKIKLKNFRLILQARAQEIFNTIARFIANEHLQDALLSGVVLTGGGSLLKQIEKVATQTLKCSCFVRSPMADLEEPLRSPAYSTCLGLLYYTLQRPTTIQPPSSLWKRVATWFSK